MKVLLVVVVALLAAANAAKPLTLLSVEETTAFDYHNRVGIPEAKRIQAEEEQLLADPSRIVGGGATAAGTHPHLGGLVITTNSGGTSVCGSSRLSTTRSVTAAHCVVGIRGVTIVLGHHLLFSGGTRVNAQSWTIHASYNANTIQNDVAMLNYGAVGNTNNIQPIALASGTNNFAGTWAWAAGWGRQSDSAGIGNNQAKHHVQLQVITNAVAQQTFGNIIIASTLCTSGASGASTCGGDSGGPLAIMTGNRQLIGITSFGAAAGCQRGFPACFARVTSFNTWISQRL